MYAGFWRILPGPVWLRVLIILVLLAGAVYLLFEYVFGWLEPYVPLNEVTIEDEQEP